MTAAVVPSEFRPTQARISLNLYIAER
jgi:hypothetical protein